MEEITGFQFVVYVIYTIGLVISFGCVIASLSQKASEQQQILLGITIFTAVMWLGSWLGLRAGSVEELIITSIVSFTGSCHIFLFQLMLMVSYCQLNPPAILYPTFCITNIFINVSAFTIGVFPFYYESVAIQEYKGLNILVTESGPFHRAHIAMQIIYSLVMAGAALKGYIKDNDKLVPLGLFIISGLIPTAASVLSFYGYTNNVDFSPIGYLISEIIIFILIYVSKICDIQDMARQYVVESMSDGIVVLDSRNRYKGSNEIAKAIIADLKLAKTDADLVNAAPTLLDIIRDSDDEVLEDEDGKAIKRDNTEKRIEAHGNTYAVTVKKIVTDKKSGKIDVKVIWLRDITFQAQKEFEDANTNKKLDELVKKQTESIEKMHSKMIANFAKMVENRDQVTGKHIERTSEYVAVLAAEMRSQGLHPRIITRPYVDDIKRAAPLHDIGKITIPDSILQKPDKLTPEEFQIMKNHTVEGGRIIDQIVKETETESFYQIARDVAVYHHEKWNGTGYPYGTAGEDIPLSARIMAVADFFDALTSSRSYKKAYSSEKTYAILKEESGKSFDPEVVDSFIRCHEEIEKILVYYGGSLTSDDDVLSARDKS